MAAIPASPLLGLLLDEILRTIRVMDLKQILKFSLFSKRCKELVASIKINTIAIGVYIGSDITISINAGLKKFNVSFYKESNMYWEMGAHGPKKRLTVPQSVMVKEFSTIPPYCTTSTWDNDTFTLQYWLKHLQDIFNYPKIDCIWFNENSSEFDIDDIKEVFGKANKAEIGNTGCFAFNQMILQKFSPFEKLSIRGRSFPDSKVPEGILIQNFDELHIGDTLERKSTFDELLLINSKVIKDRTCYISPKKLNKFIKLWQRGSNPQMEYLAMTTEEDDKETIMKGIQYDLISDNQTREFKSVGLTDPQTVTGGMDIYRMDGTKATVHVENTWRVPSTNVQIFVWFDHCVVET